MNKLTEKIKISIQAKLYCRLLLKEEWNLVEYDINSMPPNYKKIYGFFLVNKVNEDLITYHVTKEKFTEGAFNFNPNNSTLFTLEILNNYINELKNKYYE